MAMDLMYESKVHINGNRQTGKSELLLALAEKLCRQGQRVLYVAHGWSLAKNSFYRMEQSVHNLPGYRAYFSNGQERIVHESGGVVRFVSDTSSPGGFVADTLLLDDIHTDFEFTYPALATAPKPRIVRASL